MCLLFFSYKSTPGYKLVLAANRDEFLQRPAAPLGFIDKDKQILAGLDLQGGGTWLGLNRDGKFGALTNYRGGGKQVENGPTRGEIITSYLSSPITAVDFLDALGSKSLQYNGFNLILGDGNDLFYFSNQRRCYTHLEPGFYGLSNHFLDTSWPKLSRGKELLRPVMVDTALVLPEKIFDLLKDDQCPMDTELPDTGIGLEWERLLGTIFIDSPGYGTRSSAVITVRNDGQSTFSEMTHYHDGEKSSDLISMVMFLKTKIENGYRHSAHQ